ncbi:hypothetical protein JYK14_26255 [Siccirubricoccus sp. KC 17139]|uniref:Uncharacterized protein n=1 Tax=Siccirubricoccus soli TaxID=2899147 RepID=A0ABT1DCH8_9PROT|nr:hypothetical protein [Siccirubricoccus soli]MCO6419643.1 hypothetical protein [Siccirubricoccus soli]MCP2685778.1 hypothetical protein [Siccirubricoccus soli]
MMYLEPPFYMVNGVLVYRDHEDMLQHYYMPLAPRLRTTPDPATGREVPSLLLLKYRTETPAGSGGFLSLDVHLGLSPRELDDLAAEVKRLGRLPQMPRLSPVPVTDGKVRLMIFGQDSQPAPPPRPGSTPAPALEAGPRFVLKMQHAAKPSLYGDNAAAFSVQLDTAGTAIMEQALLGEMAPILVVYQLDYVALRPAFSVRLKIDWDRVQEALDEEYGQEGMFTSTQIGKTVDKLQESRAIEFTADNFVADASDAASPETARFNAARARVEEMITDAFFESSLPPMTTRPDGWDHAADILSEAHQKAMQASLGPIGATIGTFSYKKQTRDRIDRKRLDVEISERSAVLRSIYPQGHVSGLFRPLRDGDDPKRYIREIDANDPFFQRRRIRITNRGEMERDGIDSVAVRLRYGTDTKEVVLRKTGEEQPVEWASIVEGGRMRQEVEAEFTVNFRPDQGGERPLSAKAEPRTVLGEVLEVQPAEIYARVKLPVIASPSYPWDRYPQVQARLRYEDPAHGIRTDDTVILAKGQAPPEWSYLALDKALRGVSARLSHRAADGHDIETAWQKLDADLLDVRDPVGPLRLRVDVVPVVARWDDVEQIFVDLEYEDARNDVHAAESLAFNATDRSPKPFVVERKDRDHKLVQYRVTTILKGGAVLEVPRSATEAPRILVSPDMRGHRIVAVRPPQDFARAKLQRVDVELRFADAANGLLVEDKASFAAPGGRKAFEFNYVDPARSFYEWRALYVFGNGMTRRQDWQTAEADELEIAAPQ